ncbi:VCBS domain-containing protein [Halomonas sp. H10-59]|uniref:VCBS domain-containing protein n=1 Tax=Halomonas sp. H10-59 TaxID=2950874 RepID=A0AAU7KPQ1_9GAMM
MKGTRSRLIALEPRLLFDGAMAATPDPASDGDGGKPNQHQPTDGDGQAPATQADSPAGAGAPARHLVVVDARLSDAQRQTIREGLADDAELLEVDADENGIEAITAALAGMDQVESVEIFSHGASGQFQLGDTLVGNDTLTSLTASLGQWREALTADADLLLYGCRIGATDAGLELVEGLASATGMDVGASTDDTGHSGLGGDWELERQQGQLADDRGVALAALAPLDGLLADAEPTASLGESATEVPLGEEFQFTVSVSNASTAQEGYAPFVQLIVPATGKDGAGAEVDDGVIITSASYLGGQLDLYQVTFDANGEAVHPLAKDANGDPITVLASAYGAQAGDTLVVAALPFASLTSDQPSIDVTFTGQLSELADTSQTNGSPDLVIQAMAGFELGNDALSNPEQDPSLVGSAVAFTITPTVIAVEQSLDMSEGDTTTGENYPHSLVTTVRPAGATGDNDTGNNTFVLRVRLIATNTLNNQQGTEHEHKAGLTYQDVDGDEINGATAVDRDVSQPGTGPTTTLVEPTVSIEQALTTPSDPGLGVDSGDAIEYAVTFSNTSGVDAFDLGLSVQLPAELDGVSLEAVSFSDANGPAVGDFEITGNDTDGYLLSLKSGFDLDLRTGHSITLTIGGTVGATAADLANLTSEARVDWTSLDDTSSSNDSERTGANGELGDGSLNDYRQIDIQAIPIAQTLQVSRVGGLDSTAAADPTGDTREDVAVGEIIRYRVVALLPEGTTDNYQLTIQVDEGLTILPETANQIRMAFIANDDGLTSNLNTGAGSVEGNGQSPEAGYIQSDLSGRPEGVLDPARYTISGDGRTLTIDLGTITNTNNDLDKEGISLEFNVRVDNVSTNQAGTELGMVVTESRDGTSFQSEEIYERIVEPSFTDMTKTVVDFDPAPDDTIGTASVTVAFTQNGGMPAYEVVLTDAFPPSGSGYVIDSVVIDGQSYTPAGLPAGVTASATASGIELTFAQLDPGSEVSVSYSVEVPNNAPVAADDAEARLAWSSLPDDGSFDGFAGSDVGDDGTPSGERTDTDGSGGLNDYVLTAGASLGLIEGTLWNDTLSADASTAPDGDGLAGVSVTLTWAGSDDTFGNADDVSYTTVTDPNGNYSFGVLPKGSYRISASESLTDADAGELKARIDSGPSDDGSLSLITGAVDGDTTFDADIGYVELNDAPVHTLPASPVSGDEDTDITITGISIADPDALTPGAPSAPAAQDLTTTLSVNNGTLSASGDGGATVSGNGTSELVLTGSVDEINAALATLTYTGVANFNGDDTLTIVTSDNGNFGDHPDNGNGIPGEKIDDALTDRDTLAIEVIAVNDDPVAIDDSATAVEAGGRFNIGGIDPNGLVFGNDKDPDKGDADPDVLTVVRAGTTAGSLQAVNSDPASPTRIQGSYGTLVISSSGSAEYQLDNDNAAVEALRLSGNTLDETFVYEIGDRAGATSQATITITIEGANDAPVGVDDSGVAIEAGGIGNATAGLDATGNVLTNDTDVDLNGETKAVTGIRTGDELLGSFDEVTGATDVIGSYGTLTINPDGSYNYVIDNSDEAVEALAVGDTLSETFSYLVTDAEGLDDIAVLTITIEGAQDNPVATNNTTSAQAPSTDGATPAVDGTGNLIADDDGDDVDADVDTIDQGALAVGAIRPGSETAGGAMTSLGGVSASVDGQYGRLTVNADGSYRYVVDGDNAAVQALAAGATLSETFTYRLIDTAGNPDLAELVVTVTGANDPPSPVADQAIAVEAGGTANATPGDDPSGNVLTNDDDVDGQALSVDQVRFNTTTVAAGQPLAGRYGTLTLNADGSFSYVVDNSNPTVEALRTANDTLTEVFVYRSVDPLGASTTARLTVTIEGRDDAPVAADNVALAVADSDQGTGRDPSGNVLDNDSDIDAGDQLAVSGARPGTEAAGGALSTPSAGTITLTGQYGTLTLATDGSYTYAVDQTNAEILGLGPLEFRRDVFTYEARDLAGLVDLAELTVFVRGQNQAPAPGADDGLAVEAGGRDNATPGADAVGNVLDNDSDVDGDISLGVNLLGPNLTVTGVRTGDDPSAGTEGTLGKALKGRYGSLVMEADGSYRYQVDDDNPEVQALRQSGQTLVDVFTYALEDRWGGPASASLTITIDGRNDTPTARDDSGDAVDIGGGASRPDATGNVLPNDTDVDAERYGETQRVTLVAQDGVSAAPGERLAGRYGILIIEADGSYRYFIDRTNSEVLRASGLGPLLQEVFV